LKSLGSFYEAEIDVSSSTEWSSILAQFDDATIYQTWSYGAVRWGQSQLSHLILKKDGDIVAASQARIITVPILRKGIAYIPFGPLWKRSGREVDEDVFRQMIRVLYKEYVQRRGLLLRLLPHLWKDDANWIDALLSEEGLVRNSSVRAYRTFLMDLNQPREALRKGLDPKWRNYLNRSERNELEIIEGNDESIFSIFSQIYREMHARKKFAEFVNVDEIEMIQKDLPEHLKMTVMIGTFESDPVAALVCSAMGNKAIYFLGATNEKGRKLTASYVLQWNMIERLQARGYRWYDLGGTDPARNPGSHSFKSGLSGKTGKEVYSLGQFDGCNSIISSLVVKVGDGFREEISRRKIASEKSTTRRS